jgi:phosphoglucomutase/phosphomannomutase
MDDFFSFDLVTQKNVNLWLEGAYDANVKAHIRHLLKEDPQQILDAFYTSLTLGTGGLRGLMGIGTNRINVYTVRGATQGLANYIQKQPQSYTQPAVCIGYDSRQHSQEFAQEAAKVLAANQIQVYVFQDLRPTPLVSFACRHLHCIAAIMITASHNPPSYNGYKIYWTDGGQVVSPHDKAIMAEITKIVDPTMVKRTSLSHPLIKTLHNEIDDAYIQSMAMLQNYPDINRKNGSKLKIVYTSLHGTGITLFPRALQAWGFENVTYVESQIVPDGLFPTVKSPNPEEPATLEKGIDLLHAIQGDILIATDPDADRIGVAVLHQNEVIQIDGNQIAVLCLEHICSALNSQKRLPMQAAFIKTLSMTELFKTICEKYHRACFSVLTGFKYIAEKIHEWETLPNGYQYIFGGEESYGYLLGTDVRDKDAIISSALIAEVALHAKLENKTLVDKLHDLYRLYGFYQEDILSLSFSETKEGKEKIARGMHYLRESKFSHILDIPVVSIEDYSISTKFHLNPDKIESLNLPIANMILYWLADKTKIIIRPSGTEPKIKIYCSVCEKNVTSISTNKALCLQRSQRLLQFLKQELIRVCSLSD